MSGILLVGRMSAYAQCTTLGQTPSTAFPVCGSSVFVQKSVPLCHNGNIPVPCTYASGGYADVNPYWYKFYCYESGTLGLTITPKNLGDDYDWQLFDITGRRPTDVFSDLSLFVACNWSGRHGVTGTSSSAASVAECGSDDTHNPPIFSKLPSIVKGHQYLLMISHFSGSGQSGYDLAFAGGTAVITDTVVPALKKVTAICDGSEIQVIFNKRIQCGSLAADGSDFTISPAVAKVTGAYSTTCNAGFDMDTAILMLNSGLAPGAYTLSVKTGTDNNTLLDDCGQEMQAGASMSMQVVPLAPTPFDSISPVGCAPDVLQLVFSKRILCSSIAANGSDFIVNGSTPVAVLSANGDCDATGQSYSIVVHLSAPIQTTGNYQIMLVRGSDGNTIIDECGMETPAGGVLPFATKDTVSADFLNQIHWGCKYDTVDFFYQDKNGVDRWTWTFDGTDYSHAQDPEHIYSVFGDKTVRLIVSNGVCSDTVSKIVSLDNAINAAFEAPNIICPHDPATFKNLTTGHISTWHWDFGDGTTSPDSLPADHFYPVIGAERKYNVTLTVHNALGCLSRTYQQIDVLKSCYIAVPTAFTPNGDGLNDYLYPLNAFKADNLEFRVYNRWGQLVFTSSSWLSKWDGTIGGHPAPADTYVWLLRYIDRETGKPVFQKGTSLLIR
ncbi:MAG TPA: gliding motility-associated C-terminal domain-containing protein [Puia sp.]|nr:gliding motility-associated C-terminal domain-containing protein [Puia sp.]